MVEKATKPRSGALGITKVTPNDAPLKFSFRVFDCSDAEICPPDFGVGYVQTLMERLKALSTWTVLEFVTPRGKAARNHVINWEQTSRPNGFAHLPEQYEAYTAFQFALTANEHGRVHGLLIDDTFHVVWLDRDHRLYP